MQRSLVCKTTEYTLAPTEDTTHLYLLKFHKNAPVYLHKTKIFTTFASA